nr:MAG TPA: tail tape measure protein [Caudoviricetes sp.]
MANLKTEIILSMNGKAAIQVLEALRDKAKTVREEIDNLDKGAPDFKEQKAGLEKVYDALQSAHENVIKDTERLDHAFQNLTSTSLQNLRKALGDGRRQLQKLSEDDLEQAEEVRKKMKLIGDEVRLLEGQYVKIADGLKNVKNQSDQWLDKAIKQQRDLVGSLEKSDASYQQNLATLKQLEAEEDRRKGKMSEAEAHQTVTSQNASASDLRRAKTTLTEARDATPTKFTGNIEAYNNELQEIDKRLEAVSGKAQQATMSWKQMKRVLSEPNKASGEDIKRTMEVIQQKIQQLPAGSKYVADLRRQYAMLEQTLKGTRLSQSALNDILARSKQGKASLDELRRAYKQLEEELNQINTKSKEFAARQKSMKELKKNIDEATGAVNKHGGAWQTALRNLTAYVGLFAVFNQLKTYLFDIFRLNAKFAEQLTNIRKIALSTQEDVAQLSKELSKIETRTSIEELNNLAYAGAKLGIQTQNLAGFVRAADQVNVALKEDLGDEALTSLAKITEVMGLIDKYGVEEAMLKTGSAIFRLASTSTACSGKIVDFSNRLLALGDAATLSTPDILAIGSAVDSMALEPEVAATAFGKLVVELRKGTSSIEKDLGIAQGSLKKMIEEGKGMEAIQTIFHKMHESDNVFALNSLFKDLGSEDGARLTKVMVTMAEKVGMLDKAVAESNKAFREGSAVTVEYEMQQETAAAYMERAANLFEKQFVSADAASGPVRDLAKAWYEMVDALVHNVTFMTEVRILITLLMVSMKMFLGMLPTLITMLSTAGVAGAFAKLVELTTGLTGKTLSLANAWNVMYSSFKKLSFVGQMSVMGGLIGLAGVLVVKLAQWSASLNQVAAGQRVLNEVQEEGQRRAMEEQESLKRLHRVMNDTSASMDLRLEAMNKLNGAIPNLNAKINSETGAVQENTKAWEENFKRLQDYYELEGARAKLAELGRKKVDAILKLQQKEDAYANTKVDISAMPPIASASTMDEQALRTVVQTVQKGLAKRERDKAQQEYNDIVAQENALYKRFGSKLVVRGESGGKRGKKVGSGGGGNTGSDGNPDHDEKNIAKDRANALIANIKAFYEEQMRKYLEWVAQMNADGEKISEGQQKKQMDYLQSQMDRALGSARQSIATLDDSWKEVYSHMNEDVMVFDDETSKQLLESIGKADIGELHKLFTKLSGDLSRENNKTLAENLGALLDQLFANGSKELREAAEKLLARQREIQKILNEHDYTGAVNRNTRSDFDRLGFLRPADGVNADTPEGLGKMNAAFDKLTAKARESVTVLYSLNPESKEFQHQFLQFLSIANDGFDFSELKAQDLKALYLELIKYSDEYESASKKRDDERKKLNDYAWSKDSNQKLMQATIDYQGKQNKESSRKYSFGAKGDTILPWEQTEATDPELALLKLKFDLAKEYYKYIEAHNGTEEQKVAAARSIAEAHDAIMDSVASKARATAEAQMKWYKPIEKYGTALGEAMYDESKTVKQASRDMINSFIDMTGEYVQQKLTQWIMTKLYNSLMASSEQELTASKQSAAVQGANASLAEASAKVPAGIASGAAETIGQLGWWGIPLVAVISAVLGGLLSLAKGALSNAFGGNKNTAKTNNIKVTSRMLTYDSGNVQGMMPYVSESGDFYLATPHNGQHRGVSLLTHPTATTINGQPSLVAENGPEIVIGRETTRAMQMNDPQLLRALVNFDRNFSGRKAYDAGNLSEADTTATPVGASVQELVASSAVTNMALQEAVTALLKRLDAPIEAKINMYGYGQLYDSMKKAERFMRNK